ncbi:uncharacterized protein LOC112200398 [Rosa chinensis]|uniref:uncharacterized protein LOC112200398 n=1 Tax=Rosa chinensis TaxID=74649 RepID=UPI001AD8D3B2|nr:uncharacterized protein LOC112200398 [Rosa chinensis]
MSSVARFPVHHCSLLCTKWSDGFALLFSLHFCSFVGFSLCSPLELFGKLSRLLHFRSPLQSFHASLAAQSHSDGQFISPSVFSWSSKVAYIQEAVKTRFFKLLEAEVWEFKDCVPRLVFCVYIGEKID